MNKKYFEKPQAEKESRQEGRNKDDSWHPKDSLFESFRGETEVNIAFRGDWKNEKKHQDE